MPARDHRSVDIRDDIERAGVLRRDHLHDGLEAVLLVAGIDALGRIADGEIDSGLQTRVLLKNRNAVFLDRAGIDRRFIDHDIVLLEHAADRSRCRNHRAAGPDRCASSIGVGTVTMKKSAFAISAGSAVKNSVS